MAPNPFAEKPPIDPHWPSGLDPAISLCVDPLNASNSLRKEAVRRLVKFPRWFAQEKHGATHVLLDPLLAVSEGELNAYKARGQRVLSFNWAIDSFLGETEGKTEEDYEIVAGQPKPIKEEVDQGPAEESNPLAPAHAPDEELAADEQAPIKEEQNVAHNVEMVDGEEVQELSATEEQEFDSGADSDGDWSPPSLSRAAKGKQRALPHESEEDKEDSASAEPDDEEEEIDPPDEDEGHPKKKAKSKKTVDPPAPLVAHHLVLPAPVSLNGAAKEAWEAVMHLRGTDYADPVEYRPPQEASGIALGENCRADAYALSLTDGIFDLPGAPTYTRDELSADGKKAGKPWTKREDRYLIYLMARTSNHPSKSMWDGNDEIGHIMFIAAFPHRQLGGTNQRIRGGGAARIPFFHAAVQLERSFAVALPPLPNPYRYPDRSTGLSPEENAALAKLFVNFASKTTEGVGIQMFVVRGYAVLENKRRYDEFFKPWKAVWYLLYPEKTPEGKRATWHGPDPWGYRKKAIKKERKTPKRELAASRSVSPVEGAPSRSRGSIGEGPSKRVKLEEGADEEG